MSASVLNFTTNCQRNAFCIVVVKRFALSQTKPGKLRTSHDILLCTDDKTDDVHMIIFQRLTSVKRKMADVSRSVRILLADIAVRATLVTNLNQTRKTAKVGETFSIS